MPTVPDTDLDCAVEQALTSPDGTARLFDILLAAAPQFDSELRRAQLAVTPANAARASSPLVDVVRAAGPLAVVQVIQAFPAPVPTA